MSPTCNCILNRSERKKLIDTLPEDMRPSDCEFAQFFFPNMKVPDTWRIFECEPSKRISDRVQYYCSGWTDVPLNDKNQQMVQDIRTRDPVVLVLESPHADEYEYVPEQRLPIPRAPLLGSSGYNLLALAKGDDGNRFTIHPLVLVNPVQWQASLYYFNNGNGWEKCRDMAWEMIWNKSHVKNSLVERLNKYKPLLVVNCCTDDSRNGRKKLVQDLLTSGRIENKSAISDEFQVGHPSSWRGADPVQVRKIHEFLDEVLNH